MSEVTRKTFEFEATGVEQTKRQLEDLNKYITLATSAAYGILGILRKMGLGEDVTKAITIVQRMISTLNMLRTTMIALQLASGPWGWAMAGIGLAGTLITIGDQINYGMMG